MISSDMLQLDSSYPNRSLQVHLQLRIPQKYYLEPVISRLAADFNLKLNIIAAILGKDGQGDGWFDIELEGNSRQIDSALIYLSELDIEVWHKNEQEFDGW
ncbi:NIL domain-containing protein [Stanieria cyanosphaera PCC 7437]|uniref:NIL domain-containing protein n=1 Tax=Stanieria cyanosphaera (strain ATCC 29371 / PCC 7437) TaxID=111780 RepID=K9XX06_STAC7|nr:NIL domain-containing protein [Stanieria cyanosphaera]AFZ36207.1 NIL domain-containing protein [Stanieria cyanosphaera PCC 7437]